MKKYLVVLLIVVVGGATLLLPLFKDEPLDFSIRPSAAVFDFKGDPGTFVGKESELKIKLVEDNIKKLEVVYLGKVLKSWKAPKGDLSVTFVPDRVGTSTIQLLSTASDGKEFTDSRYLRVLSDISPVKRKAEVVKEYPHNMMNYTQGLDFYDGDLYEGTGQYGSSRVCRIRLEDGMDKDGLTLGLDGNYFGEGITVMNGLVYQLTWREGKCFIYKLNENYIQLDGEFNFVGQEGWGLCNDGKSLIMSDGSERITFRNPESFQVERVIDVYNDKGPIVALNELEFIDGKIYANVYQTNVVVAIDPESGKILEEIDCSILEGRGRGSGDVLNGIAHNELDGKTYMTGKYWAKLFEVKFVQ
jgi:glutamine cyclotransferase